MRKMNSIKKMTVVICAMATIFSLTACGDGKSDNSKTSAVEETIAVAATGVEKQGTGYSLTFPTNWVSTDVADCDMMMMDSSSTSETLVTNMNVVIEDVSQYGSSFTVDTYFEAVKQQFANNAQYLTMTGSKKYNVNGRDAYVVTADAKQSGVSYKIKQLYVVNNGNAYVVTFSADSEGGYDADIAEGDSILATFKIVE